MMKLIALAFVLPFLATQPGWSANARQPELRGDPGALFPALGRAGQL